MLKTAAEANWSILRWEGMIRSVVIIGDSTNKYNKYNIICSTAQFTSANERLNIRSD